MPRRRFPHPNPQDEEPVEDPTRTPQVGEVYRVALTTWVYGGEVMGRLPDGRAVFVPFALPGEVAQVRLTEVKSHYARGEIVTLEEPAPDRVPPRCPHYKVCGGCHYQHVAYAAQLAAKSVILRDQLERIGKFANPPVGATVPSPRPWGYRNHAQFHLTPQGRLGFRARDGETVVALETCPLLDPTVADVWPRLQVEDPQGLRRIHVRSGSDGQAMVVLVGEEPTPPPLRVDFPVHMMYLGPEKPYVLSGRGYVVQRVKGRAFRVSANAFFQVNVPVAEAMIDHLLRHLPLRDDATLLEVYSGGGLFSAFLAPRVGRLIAVEADPWAVADFEANLADFEGVELYEAPAEEALPYLRRRGERIDLAVVDPPRAGLSRAVLQALVDLAPQWLAYVSCHPATLARDGRQLHKAGYHLVRATPFDMFPQTYHIESITLWRRVG